MAENSKIEWTDHTFNPWRGCTKVSEGCKNCYAETLSGRNHATLGIWGPKGTRVVAAESYWKEPEKWNRLAELEYFNWEQEKALEVATEVGPWHRPRVFCASLADVFEGPETMPKDQWEGVEKARARLFDLIEATPNLDWLLLTKRPENVLTMIPAGIGWQMRFPDNVWIGTSVEDQKTADERIPHLLRIPAKVRFLSCEPLLGPVDLDQAVGRPPFGNEGTLETGVIHWVICGGESGSNARPMHPDWARSLRDQCVSAGVPFLFKQWGEWRPMVDSDRDSTIVKGWPGEDGNLEPRGKWVAKVGKREAGRILDGRTWDEFPVVK